MYYRVRRSFCAHFAVLVLWPLTAGAQTGAGVANDRSPIVNTVVGAASGQLSDDLAQDTTFLALIKARDDALALLSELKRITSYHDKLKSGLGLLSTSLPRGSRDVTAVDEELQRLKKFEDDVNASRSP
jgi:hypothetical protein